MDQNRQMDAAGLLQVVASVLSQNQGQLNQYDPNGTHGQRVAQAFQAAAQAANSANTQDVGNQFAAAAQAMMQQGKGRSTQFYANGLEQAAQQFQGQKTISQSDLLPLLQSLAGGAQKGNPAQPGQGTMLDALMPAVQAFMQAKQQGLDTQQAAMQAVRSALQGAQSTAGVSGSPYQGSSGNVDPGAASATGVIGGIVGALMPGVIGALSGQGAGGMEKYPNQPSAGASSSDPLGGLGGLLGGLGGLLGGQGQAQPDQGQGTNTRYV